MSDKTDNTCSVLKLPAIFNNSHAKGILCIIAAAFGFSLMSLFVRLSGDVPTMQKAFFRNAIALIVTVVLLLRSGGKFSINKSSIGDLFLRCFFGTCGLIANFYAIDRLNIADANILNKLSPFFAILISIPLLKEIPSKVDILSVFIAFIGALFIIRPTADMTFFPALVGLFGGFSAGTAYSYVRRLGKKGERTPIIVFAFSAFSCIVTLPFFIFNFYPMTFKQTLCLILAGIFASVGQFGITSAYRFAPAREISVFDYTQVIFAAIWGFICFGEIPTILSFIGYVIIIGTAVARWHYNLKHGE